MKNIDKFDSERKRAIIIGAGPDGLTAAHELLENTGIIPIIYEKESDVGGISKTIEYKGNRLDIGGHRFFSKSDRVMKFWQNILPIEGGEEREPNPVKTDNVMLIRNRVSRILFKRKLFDYPLVLNIDTIINLGLLRIMKIGFSYIHSRIFPNRSEDNIEDFFINRFGKELYETFFKEYTQKVWGVSCREIKPEWGSQRIKGLSLGKTLIHALRSSFYTGTGSGRKDVETSLIDQFLYPKYGPGQLWNEVAQRVRAKGGTINLQKQVVGIQYQENRIVGIDFLDTKTGQTDFHAADFLFSTMPVRELIVAMGDAVPPLVQEVAKGLLYRDFMIVGLLLKKIKLRNRSDHKGDTGRLRDNWIYIHEPDVKLGRVQIFNNWSPYMVRDPNTIFMGVEYFCNEGDNLWTMTDEDFVKLAMDELVTIDLIDIEDVLDYTVVRMPKAYPAYFGSFDDFNVIREFTDRFYNLFLVGRNGMHRYNNSDHSMLSAMTAVEVIQKPSLTKAAIWDVNTDMDYQEKK